MCVLVCVRETADTGRGVSWGPWLWVTTHDELCVHFVAPL